MRRASHTRFSVQRNGGTCLAVAYADHEEPISNSLRKNLPGILVPSFVPAARIPASRLGYVSNRRHAPAAITATASVANILQKRLTSLLVRYEANL
jgi:hypothetical protein